MYTIKNIFWIFCASWYIGYLRSFIFSDQWPEIHIWGVILYLCSIYTQGEYFVTMQWCHNVWSINFITIQICLQLSWYSRCAIIHKIQHQIWRLTLRISRDYLCRLNLCLMIWLRSKVTITLHMIWYVSSRIEEVYGKYQKNNSRLTALFLLMVLSMEI